MSVQFSFLTYSLRNFICCKIHKALRHLTQAGIWNGYIDLFLAQYKLTFMKKFGRQIYSKYAFKLNSDIRTAKIFHGRSSREDGDENSLGALWIVLPWCSVVVSMATVVLVWEFASICKGRSSTYAEFVKPYENTRENLTVVRYANVSEVLLNANNEAYGVTYTRHGDPQIHKLRIQRSYRERWGVLNTITSRKAAAIFLEDWDTTCTSENNRGGFTGPNLLKTIMLTAFVMFYF
ncbi:hypothetical protein Fcan01_23632 [Folsomia candida]|uniref:Uncharacterized protein n=1 Tax=Folsomia candida TaxID=158441 RepID=A0A226D9R4_FOLCA|nr:hypothetical protein Fcan01_23632 [Folsomia candida]